MSLDKYVEKIQSQCTWVAGNHLTYKLNEVRPHQPPCMHILKHSYAWSKIMYASFYKKDLQSLGRVHRICQERACLSPTHFIERACLVEDGTEKDGNGWNETMRKKLLGQLHLLDRPPTDECIILKESNRRLYTSIQRGETHSPAPNISLRLKLGRPLKPGFDASHICHEPNCVNFLHLVEETHIDNMNRSFADQKMKWAKLSDADVMDIYKNTTLTTAELMKKYNVADTTISGIRTGRSHGRITKDPRYKSLYIPVKDIEITAADREKIIKQLKDGSEEVKVTHEECAINPQLVGTVHWIAKNALDRGQYVSFGFKMGRRHGHVLAAIVKYELDHFPSQSGNSKKFVRHLCTEKKCCNPAHVEIGTQVENMQDRTRDGTQTTFRTDPEILEKIDADLKEDILLCTDIAKKFDVSYPTIMSRKRFLKRQGHVFIKRKYLGKRKRT